MSQTDIKVALHNIVQQYGFESVHNELHQIRAAEPSQVVDFGSLTPTSKIRKGHKSTGKPKVTAPQYVSKMDLPIDKEPLVAAVAERFQGKAFLPTIGDIGNFCQIYGIDMPASRTRANAIPRLFKFIAAMESDDISRLLNDGAFSGPSRLGPIADAIRRNGRAR